MYDSDLSYNEHMHFPHLSYPSRICFLTSIEHWQWASVIAYYDSGFYIANMKWLTYYEDAGYCITSENKGRKHNLHEPFGCITGRTAGWSTGLHVRSWWHDRLWLLPVPEEDQEDGKWHVCMWLMWQDIPEKQFPSATQIWAHRYELLQCAEISFVACGTFHNI